MPKQIQASDAVIDVLDKALKKLDDGLMGKVNCQGDCSGPIVYTVVSTLRSIVVYFKALQHGHAKKKAVQQLRKQIEQSKSGNDDNGECFRAVLALLKEEPKVKKKPSVSKPKSAGGGFRLIHQDVPAKR